VSRLIHLNGPPGIGKSTLAQRYVAEHPGVLNCDIDLLRTHVGGWATAFEETGALIRPAALAMIGAYLETGHDVVLPQMLVDPAELARFESCATAVGAEFVERVLMDSAASAVARFHRRYGGGTREAVVRAVVAENGGDEALERYHSALEQLLRERPDAVVITSTEGQVDRTYAALAASLL
jgi:predicted kinase